MIADNTLRCVRCEEKLEQDAVYAKIQLVGIICEKCFGAVSLDLLHDVEDT